MKYLKRINALLLITFFMSSVSMGSVSAMQTGTEVGAQFEGALDFVKNVFTFEYLNGENGEHRDSPILEKITNHPDRALTTIALYALTLWAAKKLYDLADKHGVFDEITAPAPRYPNNNNPNITRPQVRVKPLAQETKPQAKGIRAEPSRRKHGSKKSKKTLQRPVAVPSKKPAAKPAAPQYDGRAHIRIGNPLPGRQLNILPQLPGFYHMESRTPYHGVQRSCGFNAVYNMALIEAHAFGRQMNDAAFDQALDTTFCSNNIRMNGQRNRAARVPLRAILGVRGLSNQEADGLIRNLGLARADLLRNNGRGGSINARANQFHRTQGPCVAHFLCEVPGHWVAISVARMADGSQAMYLYDNMNQATHAREQLRRHVENIHNRFF